MLPLAPLPPLPSDSQIKLLQQQQQQDRSNNERRQSFDDISWLAMTGITVTVGLTGVATYHLVRLLQQYGPQGTLNYIWEGDPYPHIRQYLNSLESIGKALDKEQTTISSLQEALQRAQLDCVDDDDNDGGGADNTNDAVLLADSRLLALWQQSARQIPPRNKKLDLQSILGGLSYKLDALAAKIDAVPAAQDALVKKQKKNLSTRVVHLFREADALIAIHQQATAAAPP